MAMAEAYSIRDCASAIADALVQCGSDRKKLSQALGPPMKKLMKRPDLLAVGIPRAGNNVAVSSYLYFDGEMSMILFQVPKDKPIQPHDHGIWESLFLYKGRIKHTLYERADDGSMPGFADLKVVHDDVLEPGDFVIVAPPHDIHGFTALTDDTYGISVVNGAYKPERLYYDPDQKSYEVRLQKTAR